MNASRVRPRIGPPKHHGDSALRAILNRNGVQGTIAALIFAWSGITITEIALGSSQAGTLLEILSTAIAVVFTLELGARAVAIQERNRFFRENWLDILAIASAIPGLALVFPAVRLFRLLRLFRFVKIAQRLPLLSGVVRRYNARRAIGLAGLILLIAITSSAALLAFEGKENPELGTFSQAIWFSLYSIFATQPTPDAPLTLGGRIVSLLIIFTGLRTFALLTGTISAVVQGTLKGEGSTVDWEDLENHVIICGWNRKAEIILRETTLAHKDGKDANMPVVVIHRFEGGHPTLEPWMSGKVQFLDDDFTKVAALQRAGIARAKTCILLSDTSRGRSERDADARTILAALTVEKLAPKVYTCAELNRREHADHLGLGNVDDFVVSGEHSAFLLAQAAMNRGVMNVFNELLTYEYGHKFCTISVKKEWIGRSFLDVFIELKKGFNVTPVAILDSEGKRTLNPGDIPLKEGDSLVVIAQQDFEG
ncbi:ion transporter [soil metagenome]